MCESQPSFQVFNSIYFHVINFVLSGSNHMVSCFLHIPTWGSVASYEFGTRSLVFKWRT